jgi:uncharacterized protein
MSLIVNLRHLEEHSLHLEGQISCGELDIDTLDEIIQLAGPLDYNLEVQKLEEGLLVQGRLRLDLECQCVRCLKRFDYPLQLDCWTSHLPFQGEDSIKVVNDCVDLTPCIREDILLEFPQHPLCERDCSGLRNAPIGKSQTFSKIGAPEEGSPAWKELNKLKF